VLTHPGKFGSQDVFFHIREEIKIMKVLVTGTSGYIGSLLGPYLMERGHEVVGLDTGFYQEGWLYNAVKSIPYLDHERYPADYGRRSAWV
jgi:nucleoside-diphosphate-sugar epimerase